LAHYKNISAPWPDQYCELTLKIFVCARSIDKAEADAVLSALISASSDSIAALSETEHTDNWKEKVEKAFYNVNFVVFILGNDTFHSDPIKWEYAKAKSLNKQIVGLALSTVSDDTVLFCQGFPVFRKPDDCWKYLEATYQEDRQLLLEQYKIMVSSTEKVTDQRMRVNNLFFTVTSSILSISIVLGKAFEFSVIGSLGMIGLSSMALVVTFFWERLVRAYGKLNTGKFIVIDQIEKQLRTNMFENEWSILKSKVGYVSNTETEATVVNRFRWFIVVVIAVEIGFVMWSSNWTPVLSCFKSLLIALKGFYPVFTDGYKTPENSRSRLANRLRIRGL